MSYEFNPDSESFEFPNPYKVENLALITAGSIVTACSLTVMFFARGRMAHGADGRTPLMLAISVGLLLLGIGLFARAFTQLRFFFGRNRPESLAPIVPNNHDGDSPAAAELKETLRQNALTFPEPSGPLNGLLYAWLPNLILSPMVLQRTAQAQFHNFVVLAATFASFLLCWAVYGSGPAAGWIGLAYTAFAGPYVLRPMLRARRSGAVTNTAHAGSRSIVGLVTGAVLGPVVLGMATRGLPGLGDFSINGPLALALSCALAGCLVFGGALRAQLKTQPQPVSAARCSESFSINTHPNKLMEELDRILIERWYNRIPNRRYTHRSPEVDGKQGQFIAELLEETQPRPLSSHTPVGVMHALSAPQLRWLAVLTALAVSFTCAGALLALAMARALENGEPVSTLGAFAAGQGAAGLYCFGAAHRLWGRFDFVSELVWVDISGSYEAAHVSTGNRFNGNMETSKQVINIESMTMRVWVSEIDTVIFGKDAARQLVGMRGLQVSANELAVALKNFGETCSMVIVPSSAEDRERFRDLAAIAKLGAEGHAGGALPGRENLASLAVGLGDAGSQCAGCGNSLDLHARFCSFCGKPGVAA